ncbi:unnamed protein product [Amoebophrya sp. A25]|nr:unnamed protein product [Amoebophrya sp. A25]|eukprot:GSA25T00014943001.1
MSREACVVCVDALSASKAAHEELRDFAVDYLGNKLLGCLGTKDNKIMLAQAPEVGVIEVGSSETNNDLEDAEGSYANLVYESPLGPPPAGRKQMPTEGPLNFITPKSLRRVHQVAWREEAGKGNATDENAASSTQKVQELVGGENRDIFTDALLLAHHMIGKGNSLKTKARAKEPYYNNAEIVFFCTEATLATWPGPAGVDEMFGQDSNAWASILDKLHSLGLRVKIYYVADPTIPGAASTGIIHGSNKEQQQESIDPLDLDLDFDNDKNIVNEQNNKNSKKLRENKSYLETKYPQTWGSFAVGLPGDGDDGLNVVNNDYSKLVSFEEINRETHERLRTAERTVREVKSSIKSKTELEIGISCQIRIPVTVISKVTSFIPPTLKRRRLSTEGNKQEAEGPTIMRWEKVFRKENGECVSPEELIDGYKYGRNEVVPVGFAEKHMFEHTAPMCLKLLGSLKRDNLRPEWKLGESDFVIPRADSSSSKSKEAPESVFFSALAASMMAEDYVLFCRYVWRENYKPKVVVLEAGVNPMLTENYKNKIKTGEASASTSLPIVAIGGTASASSSSASSSTITTATAPKDAEDESKAWSLAREARCKRHLEQYPELLEETDQNRYVLYMSDLPFCEDMREWPFAKIPPAPTQNMRSLVSGLMDARRIEGPPEQNKFNMDTVRSACFLGMNSCILKRLVSEKDVEVEKFVQPLWTQPERLTTGNVEVDVESAKKQRAEAFKREFDLTKKEQMKKQKYWKQED